MRSYLLSAVLGCGSLALHSFAQAQGGTYRGPSVCVPPTTVSAESADLTLWTYWWELHKEPYLQRKARIHALGRDTSAPSDQQIRERVVPVLLAALESETQNDIVTGCLNALAKLGDAAGDESAGSAPVIERFLADPDPEVREAAAVALGILGSPRAIGTLEALLLDSPYGRQLVGGAAEVPQRTRAFAAYGLGLIGSGAAESDRVRIVALFRRVLESMTTGPRDLAVGCIIGMGLVPLETIEGGAGSLRAESSRLAQLEFVSAVLGDWEQRYLVRAHCPTALVRLLRGLPEPLHSIWRERIAEELIARVTAQKDAFEVVQSAVLALGSLGTNDGAAALDRKIRGVLAGVPEATSDTQTRRFAMIALAEAGGRPGEHACELGIDETTKALLFHLENARGSLRPWAGLACGVLAHRLVESGQRSPAIESLQSVVRRALGTERNPAYVGAYAISAGIMGDVEATPLLLARLDSEKSGDALGYAAVALGLLGAREEATARIQELVETSARRPELLKQAATALVLLGDQQLVPKLTEMLLESKSLAPQAILASALGHIGDGRAIDPLTDLLEDQRIVPVARGFAAVALGIVADEEPLPWSSRIAVGLNYRAATETLTDAKCGTGILDIP